LAVLSGDPVKNCLRCQDMPPTAMPGTVRRYREWDGAATTAVLAAAANDCRAVSN